MFTDVSVVVSAAVETTRAPFEKSPETPLIAVTVALAAEATV